MGREADDQVLPDFHRIGYPGLVRIEKLVCGEEVPPVESRWWGCLNEAAVEVAHTGNDHRAFVGVQISFAKSNLVLETFSPLLQSAATILDHLQ